ncbi:MAG: hypothetical protein HXK09_00105 [Actinomyces bouchesdurhonensis]|uniref:Uncharacterized protein n=1 Tax=Actinomyces bouchesdurhonensis TaxID=1852361 RepID=A0A929RNP9_9ACTO|nr:hypothetical protein [Actinomyces bouchesdurhonensis]
MTVIKATISAKITFKKMGADYGDNPSVLAAIDAVVTALDGLSDAVVMSEIEA